MPKFKTEILNKIHQKFLYHVHLDRNPLKNYYFSVSPFYNLYTRSYKVFTNCKSLKFTTATFLGPDEL
jgi:hypothetical protein